jgi:hypothetical protein
MGPRIPAQIRQVNGEVYVDLADATTGDTLASVQTSPPAREAIRQAMRERHHVDRLHGLSFAATDEPLTTGLIEQAAVAYATGAADQQLMVIVDEAHKLLTDAQLRHLLDRIVLERPGDQAG